MVPAKGAPARETVTCGTRETPPVGPDRREVAGSFPQRGPGRPPELTRDLREGRPRIVQQPLSSELLPMITMVIRPFVGSVARHVTLSTRAGWRAAG